MTSKGRLLIWRCPKCGDIWDFVARDDDPPPCPYSEHGEYEPVEVVPKTELDEARAALEQARLWIRASLCDSLGTLALMPNTPLGQAFESAGYPLNDADSARAALSPPASEEGTDG